MAKPKLTDSDKAKLCNEFLEYGVDYLSQADTYNLNPKKLIAIFKKSKNQDVIDKLNYLKYIIKCVNPKCEKVLELLDYKYTITCKCHNKLMTNGKVNMKTAKVLYAKET